MTVNPDSKLNDCLNPKKSKKESKVKLSRRLDQNFSHSLHCRAVCPEGLIALGGLVCPEKVKLFLFSNSAPCTLLQSFHAGRRASREVRGGGSGQSFLTRKVCSLKCAAHALRRPGASLVPLVFISEFERDAVNWFSNLTGSLPAL